MAVENLKKIKQNKMKDRWVWDGILKENTVNILVGQQSRGKSMLALGLVKEMLKTKRGQEYLGRGVRKQRVLYISSEMSSNLIASRLGDLKVDGRLKGIQNRFFVDYNTTPTINSIQKDIEECNPDFIVIDIMGGLLIGEGYDLNDYQSLTEIAAKLRSLNKTFLLVHHMNKQKQAMGSIAALAAMDTRIEMLEIDRYENEDFCEVINQEMHVYGKAVSEQRINVSYLYPAFILMKEEAIEEELDKPISKLMQEVILSDEAIEGTYQEVAAKCKLLEKYQFNPKKLGSLLRMNKDVLDANDIHFETSRKAKGIILKIWYEPNEDIDDQESFIHQLEQMSIDDF